MKQKSWKKLRNASNYLRARLVPTKSLQRRLNRLEGYPSNGPDFIELTLATLSDKDLLLLQESATLHQEGLDEPKIAEIMGDRYPEAQQAADRFNKEYSRFVAGTGGDEFGH